MAEVTIQHFNNDFDTMILENEKENKFEELRAKIADNLNQVLHYIVTSFRFSNLNLSLKNYALP